MRKLWRNERRGTDAPYRVRKWEEKATRKYRQYNMFMLGLSSWDARSTWEKMGEN